MSVPNGRIRVSLDWDNTTIRVSLLALGDEFLYKIRGRGIEYFGKEARSGGWVCNATYKDIRKVAYRFAKRLRALRRMRRSDPEVRADAKAIMLWYRKYVARFSDIFDRPGEDHVHRWYKMSPARTRRHTRERVRAVLREIALIASKRGALLRLKVRKRKEKQEAKEAHARAQPKLL